LFSLKYFTLKMLAAYSSSSIRWLRDRLTDSAHPLPYYRIEGEILVRRADFDQWLAAHRVVRPAERLNELIDSVMMVRDSAPRRRP
jgi:hypothetical protein